MRWLAGVLVGVVGCFVLVGSVGGQYGTPVCDFYWPPPGGTPYPCVYRDLNKDGYVTMVDVNKVAPIGAKCGLPYTPAGCGAGGGVCQLTEAQGVDFVNGVNTLVILAAVGVPCLVALVTGLSFLFFARRG